jgi:hypothetical protein
VRRQLQEQLGTIGCKAHFTSTAPVWPQNMQIAGFEYAIKSAAR